MGNLCQALIPGSATLRRNVALHARHCPPVGATDREFRRAQKDERLPQWSALCPPVRWLLQHGPPGPPPGLPPAEGSVAFPGQTWDLRVLERCVLRPVREELHAPRGAAQGAQRTEPPRAQRPAVEGLWVSLHRLLRWAPWRRQVRREYVLIVPLIVHVPVFIPVPAAAVAAGRAEDLPAPDGHGREQQAGALAPPRPGSELTVEPAPDPDENDDGSCSARSGTSASLPSPPLSTASAGLSAAAEFLEE